MIVVLRVNQQRLKRALADPVLEERSVRGGAMPLLISPDGRDLALKSLIKAGKVGSYDYEYAGCRDADMQGLG